MTDLLSVYTNSLIQNIDDRFKQSLPLLTALDIFNPLKLPDDPTLLSKYGEQSILKIIEHFCTGITFFLHLI